MRKLSLTFCILLMAFGACRRKERASNIFQNKGSDTMVNLAQGWAEAYRSVNKDVAIAVTGGGSGTGIASLLNGTVDIANSSRAIKPEESKKAKEATGKDVVGSVVALDALAVFVHKDNGLKGISLEDLKCIYGEGGKCEKWSDFSLQVPGCPGNQIVRVSRQSNSGTYQYFREAIMGEKGDFMLGSRDMNGSKDVVDLVEKTPCAIGYTGMGYLTPTVRALCVSKSKGSKCVEPNEKTALDKTYPIARELYMYSLGTPSAPLKAYLDWIKGPEGQALVSKMGYVTYRKN